MLLQSIYTKKMNIIKILVKYIKTYDKNELLWKIYFDLNWIIFKQRYVYEVMNPKYVIVMPAQVIDKKKQLEKLDDLRG